MSAHNDGSIEVLTGKTPARPDPTSTARSEHPDFGMVASKVRGVRPDGLPRYVGIPRQPFMTRPTYLGVAPLGVRHRRPVRPGLPPPDPDARRRRRRPAARRPPRALLDQFDGLRRGLDREAGVDGGDPFRDAAFQMLTSPQVAAAFDLAREDPRLRDRYGRHLWGQSCLLARRLAEAGSSVITIDALAPTLSDRYFSWDDHINAADPLGPGRGDAAPGTVHGPGDLGADRGRVRPRAWTGRC